MKSNDSFNHLNKTCKIMQKSWIILKNLESLIFSFKKFIKEVM